MTIINYLKHLLWPTTYYITLALSTLLFEKFNIPSMIRIRNGYGQTSYLEDTLISIFILFLPILVSLVVLSIKKLSTRTWSILGWSFLASIVSGVLMFNYGGDGMAEGGIFIWPVYAVFINILSLLIIMILSKVYSKNIKLYVKLILVVIAFYIPVFLVQFFMTMTVY